MSHRRVVALVAAAALLVTGGCVASTGGASRSAPTVKMKTLTRSPSLGSEATNAVDPVALEQYQSTYRPGDSSVKIAFLPSLGFGTIQTFAASGTTPDVWAWSASATDSRVWHYDSQSGHATSWSLGSTGDVMGASAFPQLTACGSRAWFGIGHTLIELSSESGVLNRLTAPTGEPIPQVEAYRPANLRGISAIDALACSDTTLVVGLANSNTAQILDLATREFSAVSLPAEYEVASAAVARGGVIGLGLRPYGPDAATTPHLVLEVDAAGREIRRVVVADAAHLQTDGDSFLAGSSLQRAKPGDATADPGLAAADDAGVVSPRQSAPLLLPDGRIVRVGHDSTLRVSGPDGATSTPVSLGRDICGDDTTPIRVAEARPTDPSDCAVGARFFVGDGQGHLFVVPTNGGSVPVLAVPVP